MSAQYLPSQLYANGFTDLISVVPPGAALVPSSTLNPTQVGKIPGRKLANGLWAGYDWRRAVHTAAEVARWNLDGANVGMRTDRYPVLDIDCLDEALADIIEQAAVARLGAAPIRTGRAPKRLLLFRLADGAESFSRMRLYITKGETEHLVEVLAQGQQFVCFGSHPTTMRPYQWDTTMSDLTPDHLPVVDREKMDAFLDELAGLVEAMGVGFARRQGDGRVVTRESAPEQQGLQAPSIDLLRECVRRIPNTNDLWPERDDYIRIGYAIRAAAQQDEEEGYAIFAEWAAKHTGSDRVSGNPETWRSDWRRFKPPFTVGWDFLAATARQFGFQTADLEFSPVQEAERGDPGAEAAPFGSDQWVAEQVAKRQRGRLRYVPQKGTYLVWEQTRWQLDAELYAEEIIRQELKSLSLEQIRRGATEAEKREALKLATALCSAGKLESVAKLVRIDRSIAVSLQALDHDPWLLNTPGGIVDLRTGVLTPSDPDALATKLTGVPVDFGGTAARWLQFLQEACGGDTALIGYLQRLCGYALTGSTREQQLTFIYGPGGNGKSVFLNVLTGVLGDYAKTAAMDTFTASHNDKHSTDVAGLVGARLVTASETGAGKRWDEPRIKSLTGGEPVTARFMRQDNFTFLPQFKLIFVGNHKPEIRDVDAAMRRRIHLVPFEIKPAVVDQELGAKLREEWPAILAWMIEGCLAWQAQGLAAPASVRDATEAYFNEEDAVGRWIEECCERDAPALTETATLFDSWRQWAQQGNEYVGSLKRFSSALAARRFARELHPLNRRSCVRGLRLKAAPEMT